MQSGDGRTFSGTQPDQAAEMSGVRKTSEVMHAWGSSAVFVVGMLAACSAPVVEDGEMSVAATTFVPDVVIRSGPVQEPGKAWEMFRPVDIAAIGDSLLITDSGNDRVVLLDGALRFVRGMGREGSGPGEYRGSFGVRWTGRDVIVSDLGNGRVSWLSAEGDSHGVLQVTPVPQSFDVLADGTLLMPSRGGTHYLERYDGDSVRVFADRPDSLTGEELKSARAGGQEVRVAVTAGDTVHVFDDATGELIKISPDGRRRMVRSLPRAFLDSMVAYRKKGIEGFARQGLHVWQWPLAKGLTVTDDGRLLLLIRNGSTAGLVIDPHTYDATRIVVPPRNLAALPLLSASRAILRGRVLTVLVADSVIDYRLSEVPG
jgi:hypothetical protein